MQTQKSWRTFTTAHGMEGDSTEPESRPKTPKKKKVLSKPIEQIDPNMINEKLSKLQGT